MRFNSHQFVASIRATWSSIQPLMEAHRKLAKAFAPAIDPRRPEPLRRPLPTDNYEYIVASDCLLLVGRKILFRMRSSKYNSVMDGFDIHLAYEQLIKDECFTAEQAKRILLVLKDSVTGELATKSDTTAYKADVTTLKADIAALRIEI